MSQFSRHKHTGGEGAAIPAWTLLENPEEKTADYTLTDYDSMILTNGSFTLTLPAVTDGKRYKFKNIGAQTVTIVADGLETIDGEPNLQLTLQYDYLEIIGTTVTTPNMWLITGGGNVKLTEILEVKFNEEIELLYKILKEAQKGTLHLSAISDENITDKDVS